MPRRRRRLDRDDGGFSADELARLRADLRSARRHRAVGRVLGLVGIVFASVGTLGLFTGWMLVPREAVGAVGGVSVVVAVVGAILVRVFARNWSTEDAIVGTRQALLDTAVSLTGGVDLLNERRRAAGEPDAQGAGRDDRRP